MSYKSLRNLTDFFCCVFSGVMPRHCPDHSQTHKWRPPTPPPTCLLCKLGFPCEFFIGYGRMIFYWVIMYAFIFSMVL